MSKINLKWEKNESLKCPNCDGNLLVVFEDDKYQTHGCGNCQKFMELENYVEFYPC